MTKPLFENGKLKCLYTLKNCPINETTPYASCPGCHHNTTRPYGPNEIEVLECATNEPGVRKIAFVANGQSIPFAFVPPHWLKTITAPIENVNWEEKYNDLLKKGDKVALSLLRLSLSIQAHPDYTGEENAEWTDYINGAEEALKDWPTCSKHFNRV